MASIRSTYVTLSDAELISQCEVDTYRASGPGGQKRNKTSSAVRLRHTPTGLIVIAEESRSQHENKTKAVKRLRRTLFLSLREPFEQPHPDVEAVKTADGRLHVTSARDPRFWPAAAALLDGLSAANGQVSTAAESIGTTTANLIAFFEHDPNLWQAVNHLRAALGHSTLRPKS